MARRPTFGGWKVPKAPKARNPFAPAKAAKPIKPNAKKNPMEAAATHAKAIEALRRSLCLTFTYDDMYRVVEVHTVGTTTAGRPAMCVYQIDGQTDTPPLPGWRLFCMDECFDVAVSDLPAHPPRPDYKKGAKQFRSIDAEF